MHTYLERATDVACESSVAVTVLLSADNSSVEFWPLKPEAERALTSPEEFTARKLRSVGVVGLCGLSPRMALKEPLAQSVVDRIALAFQEHVNIVLYERFEEFTAAAEVAELQRVYSR